MDEKKTKELWKSSNDNLQESLILNRKSAEDITKMKVQHFVTSMKPIKIFTILVGIVWVGLGFVMLPNLFIFSFEKLSMFFLLSASIQVLLTAIALIIYIYQLILINQVDISQPILATQEKLARLRSSTLWVARLLILQLPVWTTFYWNKGMLDNGNLFLWILQAATTLSFTIVAFWLFFNINNENRDKAWFRLIFKGKEWTPMLKSMELLSQIVEYSTEINLKQTPAPKNRVN